MSAPKKAAPVKKAPSKPAEAVRIELTMTVDRETPGTFRFAADTEDASIPTLYIKKAAFGGTKPVSISIVVEVESK